MVARAISIRSRLRGCGSYDGDTNFEFVLQCKKKTDFQRKLALQGRRIK